MNDKNSSTKKCIVQILPALNSGGVERGVVDVSIAARDAGFKSIVISNGGILVPKLREAKIRHFKMPLATKNPIKMFFNIGRINKIIKKQKVDLIHIRSRAPAWSAYFAWQHFLDKIKLISTVHGPYSVNLIGKAASKFKICYNSVMIKPKFIIAVSNFIKDYIETNYSSVENLDNKEIRVIHRGVDIQQFDKSKVENDRVEKLKKSWKVPEDKTILMLPARITGWKGHEFLLDALQKLDHQDFLCLMVGNTIGHEKFAMRLEERIAKEGLSKKVKIVGQTKDMPACYEIADVVISASTKPEAFGRIAIETGAMEKIIIATNVGGSLETVIDGKTGFLVENKNADDLAKKIDLVLDLTKSQREEIGKNAVKHIRENFSNQKMLDKTIEFYSDILSTN